MSSNTPSPSPRRVFSGPPAGATTPTHAVTSLSRRSSVASPSLARTVSSAGHSPNPFLSRLITSNPSDSTAAGRARSGGFTSTPSHLGSVGPQARPEDSGSENTGGLVSDLNKLSMSEYPKRPGHGTLGKSVDTLTNFFDIDLGKAPDLSQYTFTIKSADNEDSAIRARTRARALFLLLQHNPDFRFSATNYTSTIVSTRPLTPVKNIGKTYVVDYYEPEERGPRTGAARLQLYVTLQFLRTLYIKDLKAYLANQRMVYTQLEEHIAAINTMFSRFPAQDTGLVSKARRDIFFKIRQQINDRNKLGDGIVAYKGYFKSVRLTQSGLRLLVNVTASAFYEEGSLHELIEKLIDDPSLDGPLQKLNHLDRMLRLLRVQTTYTGRPVVKTIFGVARCGENHKPTADKVMFMKDGRSVSVAQHFATTYPRVPRNYLGAVVVDVGGRQEHRIYIPSDLCTILPGQLFRGLLPDPSQASTMIKFACRPPHQNQSLILDEGLPQIGVHENGGPEQRFNLNTSRQMVQIKARILPAPQYTYNNRIEPKVGSGSWLMTGNKFFKPPDLSVMKISWLEFVQPKPASPQNRHAFLQKINEALQGYTGHRQVCVTTFENFQHTRIFQPSHNYKTIASVLADFVNKHINLVLVFLPSKAPQFYRSIKMAADATVGIHTVCCWRQPQNPGRPGMDGALFANQAIKINTKLGGINLTLKRPNNQLESILRRRIMFVGADVVHPGKGAMEGAPSVAAVVASIDSHYSLYPGSYTLQQPDDKSKHAIEWITNFGEMMKSRLALYYKKNKGQLPEIIFIYRDGVGDSMYAEVLNRELVQIQRECRTIYTQNKQPMPKIVYLVVTKRIHNRFYQPSNSKPSTNGFDNRGNPLPGFVVDREITSGNLWDWFMVSHKCLQGTSVPKHYVVLHDELGIGPDQLQYLTYAMCFLLPRCTNAISVHVAARAADLMCDRAKIYLHSVYFPTAVGANGTRPTYIAKDHWTGSIAEKLKDTMFYI